jgi:dihydroorotate dehydrogenase subfamily 2
MIKFLSDVTRIKYKYFVKPILFLFDAETVHNSFVKIGTLASFIPPARWLIRTLFGYQHQTLRVEKDGISFPNPVGLSAGFDYNGQLTGILPAVGFGFHTIGTITYEPYAGNPRPRLGRLPKSQAILVNKGLKNMGARACVAFLKNRFAQLPLEIPTGISIGSTNKGYSSLKEQILDTLKCFYVFEKSNLPHSYYELNISCPNTHGGEPFSIPSHLEMLLTCLDKMAISRPIYVKFPIDQSWQESKILLDIISKHSPAGVIIGNLTKDKANPLVHPEEKQIWAGRKGNLSGKPTWERSNALIKKTRQTYGNRFTIIGTGGIFTGKDAQYKMDLGADLVQLITGMIFEGPAAIGQINYYLANKTK